MTDAMNPIQAAEDVLADIRAMTPDAYIQRLWTALAELLAHARTLEAELARKTAVADAYWEIVESFRAENADLRAALEPFAEYHGSDEYLKTALDDGLCAAVSFTAGDYRRTRAALTAFVSR